MSNKNLDRKSKNNNTEQTKTNEKLKKQTT